METDSFVGKIVITGTSLGIIIPAKLVQFSGLKQGDLLKIWFKKKGEK